MKVEQLHYRNQGFIRAEKSEDITGAPQQLVLGFGAKPVLESDRFYIQLKQRYPAAQIILCSTSGEIYDDAVFDDTISVIAAGFEKTHLKAIQLSISDYPSGFEAGKSLYEQLNAPDLVYMLVISDGAVVNGSELVRGIESVNTRQIPVTGGLAGDAAHFNYTLVGVNQEPGRGHIAAVGFYGNSLRIGHGSMGGWETFGPERTVTRSTANKLFEIDYRNALEIYKTYLGKYADELPGSALLFPLSVRLHNDNSVVVRTILSINNEEQSMIFAGDIPEGSKVRFMKANFDRLIEASMQAAAQTQIAGNQPKLALLISCVGRKLILGKRIDEETESVREIMGPDTFLTGFYSYGEISPLLSTSRCELHNQTMTITTFDEI
jgi:hypothetical protein